MSSNQKIPDNTNYLPAVYKEDKSGKYIVYYCYSPITGRRERVRIKLNKIYKQQSKADFRRHVASICQEINAKLFAGINPFVTGENAAKYVRFPEAVQSFISAKSIELRVATMRSYNSYSRMIVEWVQATNPSLFVGDFSKSMAVRFLDHVATVRRVSGRSYNNYLKFCRCLFGWLQERGHIETNPFEAMKRKRQEEKKRVLIDEDTRKKIYDYLIQENRPFLLVCQMVFNSLIRPKEIRFLKVENLNLSENKITVSGKISKNHKTRETIITPQMKDLFLEHIKGAKKDFYLFGPSDFLPAALPSRERAFSCYFRKLRAILGLPDNMQLYSFRDTGITDLLKSGADGVTVMQLADHSSLDITTIYTKHKNPHLIEDVLPITPKF